MDPLSQIVHLSKRAGFGESLQTINSWRTHGYEHTVDSLFHATPDLVADIAPLGNESKETRGSDFSTIRQAWINRMVTTNQSLVEKMTLFWHDHFATAEYKVNSPALMLRQNNTLRRNALGSFRQMLIDITSDPAMLIWLDNAKSTKKAPNENYGRELMELFTIGLTYTQADVTAASEAMTGYELNRKTGEVRFVPSRHSDVIKTFFGHSGNLGPVDIIDDLLANPNCAPFVVTKILKWFVHPAPPTDWVDKFAKVFVNSDYRIDALMRAIFLSDEFQTPVAVGSLVKSPADYVVGLIRMTDASIPVRQLDTVMTSGGMQLFNPPNVAGWVGGQSWLSSSTLLSRFNFAFVVAKRVGAKHLPGASLLPGANPLPGANSLPGANPLAGAGNSTSSDAGHNQPQGTDRQVLSESQLLLPSTVTSNALANFAEGHTHLSQTALVEQLRYLAWISPEFQMC